MPTIAIIGLGLIGTSLGLALKESNLSNVEIVGNEVDREAATRSARRGAVDRVEPHLPEAVKDASMVIIATPVLAIRDVLREIAPHLREDAIVTDTGSTKTMVLQWAAEYLPPSVTFVGGHPMAGKTESGPDEAEADLFAGATYCIIPGRNAQPKAIQAVLGMVAAVEAVPYFVEAIEHDSYVAAISHLPIAISTALVSSTARSPSWREMAGLAAGAYQDVTRLAQGDPIMNRDIFLTNQEAIVHWIDELIKELYNMRTLLKDGAPDLQQQVQDLFYHAWESRTDWITGVSQGDNPLNEIPGAAETLARTLGGGWAARKFEPSGKGDDKKSQLKQASKLKEKGKGWFRR